MNERENLYLITYRSLWGMGSDTEVGIIAESDLRELILYETGRFAASDNRADSRFSGTACDEVFCDSNDPEERIADVMNKRLNKSTTYSGKNDLIELPPDVKIDISDMKMGKTIVRLTNQFGFGRDIIFSQADLKLYSINLEQDFFSDYDVLDLEDYDGWARYVSYSLKNVSEYHMGSFSTLDFVIDSSRAKLNRMLAEQQGTKVKHKGAYITDLIPEIADDEYIKAQIAEARCTLDKFSNLPEVDDEYDSYMYDLRNCRSTFMKDNIKRITAAESATDHTRMAYDYPIAPEQFALMCEKHEKDASRKLTYSELFNSGYDMRYLIADYSNRAKTKEGLGKPDLVAVFLSAFAYD